MFPCTVEDNGLPVLCATPARLLPSVKSNIHVSFRKLWWNLGVDHFCVWWIRVCRNLSNGLISLQDNFYVRLSWPPLVIPPHGNILLSPPKFSKQQHEAGRSTDTLKVFQTSPLLLLHLSLVTPTRRPALTLTVCGTFRTERTSGNVYRNVESFTFRKQIRRTRRNS